MSAEILINVTPRESRAAVIENGILHEVFVERANRLGLTSNVYKGRVSRVLPGMQAAFIDVGLTRTAFLHASDIARGAVEGPDLDSPPLDIRALVAEGDELLVQVVKDPLGTKGARLTTFVREWGFPHASRTSRSGPGCAPWSKPRSTRSAPAATSCGRSPRAQCPRRSRPTCCS